jgi:hypothetical protein
MVDYSKFKTSIDNEKNVLSSSIQTSNPLGEKAGETKAAVTDYSQTLPRQQYDKDIAEIVEIVRILNNMAPIKMPEYNFNIDEINGERYYKPDGTLLLVREYDSDVIRDYYAKTEKEVSEYTVSRILEHDKITGRLRTKIEPISRRNSRLKTNITIFDLKVNNKYIIMQLSEGGFVNNISEFTGKGKSFQTMFRNINTLKPARYLEGKDNFENGFEMVDCIFDAEGNIVRIKRFSNKKEVNIEYTEKTKSISVKNKV